MAGEKKARYEVTSTTPVPKSVHKDEVLTQGKTYLIPEFYGDNLVALHFAKKAAAKVAKKKEAETGGGSNTKDDDKDEPDDEPDDDDKKKDGDDT